MGKLLKYEWRKNRTSILIFLGLTLGLQLGFLYGLYGDSEDWVLPVFTIGLVLCAYAAMIYVMIVGVTSYSKEMKQRSAYLIFMTPNSGMKIMGSKYLFTLTVGVMFVLLYGVLGALDIALTTDIISDIKAFIDETDEFLLELGVHLDQFILAALVVALYVLLSLLSFFAVAYLAITLSHTLFRDKKWRGIVALGIFFGLNLLISEINGALPNPLDELTYQESAAAIKIAEAYGVQTTATINDVLLGLLPSACVSLVTVLTSLFGCAWMLDKKVSL